MRSYLRSRQSVDPAQAILGEDRGRKERNHGTAVGAEEALVRRLLEDTQDGDHPVWSSRAAAAATARAPRGLMPLMVVVTDQLIVIRWL